MQPIKKLIILGILVLETNADEILNNLLNNITPINFVLIINLQNYENLLVNKPQIILTIHK